MTRTLGARVVGPLGGHAVASERDFAARRAVGKKVGSAATCGFKFHSRDSILKFHASEKFSEDKKISSDQD